MVNEIFFFTHILIVLACVVGALRLGKVALMCLVALQAILANLFVIKQVDLFGLTVTGTDVFAVGSILGLNLLQEYSSKEAAKEAIRVSFVALVFFTLMGQLHLFYLPSSADRTQEAFQTIFEASPRIVLASMSVFFFVQQLDIRLFALLRRFFQGKYLPMRMGISLLITQGLDTVLFSFLGLYGIVESVWNIIFLSFSLKCIVIASASFFVALTKRWVSYVPV